ncbi:hypothetical protein HCN44_003973 [Aphidius gifuensis]|uniref:Uncharacterized protein n=1 Tax=Aphidius gifuensis TaxID=684658 RepID=A0A834Y0U7_APHGI|nr:putative histone-lysine N-methyltransferase 1 [Aphidius gifuensis]KAF7994501.1 hypothetical protein HCN44_003973 [Aphidius gifuensis]
MNKLVKKNSKNVNKQQTPNLTFSQLIKPRGDKTQETIYVDQYAKLGKGDYIRDWLMTHKQRSSDDKSSPSSTIQSCVNDTPPGKRTPMSPLTQFTNFKRQKTDKPLPRILFPNIDEEAVNISKELFSDKENNTSDEILSDESFDKQKTNNDNINTSSTTISPRSKLAAFHTGRNNINDKKIIKNNRPIKGKFMKSNRLLVNQQTDDSSLIISSAESPVSLMKKKNCLSPNSSDICSVNSSPIKQVDKIIEHESDDDRFDLIESPSDASDIDNKDNKNTPKYNRNIKNNIVNNLLLKKVKKNFNKTNFDFIEEPDNGDSFNKTLCDNDIVISDDELSCKNCKYDDSIIEDPENNNNDKTIVQDEDNSRIKNNIEEPIDDLAVENNKEHLNECVEEVIEDPDDDGGKKIHDQVDEIVQDYSETDSDKTYWSNSKNEQQDLSQKISQVSPSLQGSLLEITNSDFNILSCESTISRPSDSTINPIAVNPVMKKKQKAKKGTLEGKVQTLVSNQVSFLRIWRHQMSQARFQGATTAQCVKLKITNIIHKYHRQIFYGVIIDDTHGLFDKSIDKTSSSQSSQCKNSNDYLNRLITIITSPEIVGKLNFEGSKILRIYPPWDVIDYDKLILSCLYFNVVNDKHHDTDDHFNDNNVIRVVKKFNCPCIKARKMTDNCNVKLTNSNLKPNVIQYLFDH